MSKILSKSAIKALTRIGDILCPKNGEFPSYSETGCVEHVDDVIAFAPASDIGDLNMVLSILSYMPTGMLNWLVKTMNDSQGKDGGIAVVMRQLDFGLKGIIYSTYYSGKVGANYTGKTPQEVIDFSIVRMEN